MIFFSLIGFGVFSCSFGQQPENEGKLDCDLSMLLILKCSGKFSDNLIY